MYNVRMYVCIVYRLVWCRISIFNTKTVVNVTRGGWIALIGMTSKLIIPMNMTGSMVIQPIYGLGPDIRYRALNPECTHEF